MKRFFSILIASLMLVSLVSCSNADIDENTENTGADTAVSYRGTINVYNWGEYISDGSEGSLDVNSAFTEATGIKVNYTTYASNEDMYAKLKSGATGYDVIIPSDYMIKRLLDEGMLEKLNYDNIPNFKYISEDFHNPYYDPQNEYTVPYTYGMVGVIYNASRIDEEDIGTWDLLWNEKYKGDILQYNNSRDAFGTAMYRLGIDVNTENRDEWNRALEALKEQKELVQSYVMDEIFNKMESGEAGIASYYAGDYLTMSENNENLAFYYPSEGTNIFIDAMCVPKGSKNKSLAEEYINFMLSKEAAVANAEYICYACPNTLVTQDADYIEYMGEEAMEVLYPEDFDFKTEYDKNCYKNLPTQTLNMVNELWEELKIDSNLGAWVYVGCILIILMLAGIGVSSFVVKKKRSKYY
ncbi:MAG: spermidine/putrescine ABC transporter substrate-binding protein [Clostridia bacterium]|nr:spermidine/putrescine ABC transporter substrate-binding protein [Clostridia bacterium]